VIRKSAKSPSFDAAATAAARQYLFSPARKGGQAVRCWFSVGIPFQLPRQ
jgi:outer membrane biosynthesis protein TonB